MRVSGCPNTPIRNCPSGLEGEASATIALGFHLARSACICAGDGLGGVPRLSLRLGLYRASIYLEVGVMPARPARPVEPAWSGAMKSPPIIVAGEPGLAVQRLA